MKISCPHRVSIPGAGLPHIGPLTCQTQNTHPRYQYNTHEHSWQNVKECLCVVCMCVCVCLLCVCMCARKTVNYKNEGREWRSLWSASFPCCSSIKAQPPHVKQELFNINSSSWGYCCETRAKSKNRVIEVIVESRMITLHSYITYKPYFLRKKGKKKDKKK